MASWSSPWRASWTPTGPEEAERDLWACLEQGHYRLVLDLSGLTYLSSAGLRVLLRFHQRITSLGGELILAAQTLATKGVDAIVQVSDNVVYAAFQWRGMPVANHVQCLRQPQFGVATRCGGGNGG